VLICVESEFIGSGGKIAELDIVIGHDVISPGKISTQNGVVRMLSLFNDLNFQ
jgi:hypothetical protein